MTENSPSSTLPDDSDRLRNNAPVHARRSHSRGILKGISLVVVGLLAFGATAAFAGIHRVQNMATKVDISDLVSPPPVREDLPKEDVKDADAGHSLNILVLGTDDRSGVNGELAGDSTEGMRADTTMLVHLSSDRSRAEVVSIPRDSMVYVPKCRTTDGQVLSPVRRTMFNNAFARGWDAGKDLASAAACTVNTVQTNTGLTIDHFVVVDFAGYKDMVDALGGIDIDIPEPINARKVGSLQLDAGPQTLDGTTALKLVRARKGTGWGLELGSDLGRIDRQQAVVAATIDTALSKNFLTDLPKLTGFLTAAMTSLTMNPELSDNLFGLVTSMTGISASNIEFTSVPVADDPADRNRVVWTSAANDLWDRLLQDLPSEPEVSDQGPVTTPSSVN